LRNKKYAVIILVLLAVSFPINSVLGQAGLLSNSSPLADRSALMSAVPADSTDERQGILSAPVSGENDNTGLLSYPSNGLLPGLYNQEYDFDFNELQWDTGMFDISITSPLNALEELQPMSYAYRPGMGETYIKLNNDAASIINRYMERAHYIPVKDPLWLLAIGAVEYNYRENESDIIFSWPVDTFAARDNPDYLLNYNWREVRRIGGDDLVTRRTGGAIGPFQMESFFGANTEPLIPDDFGLIGSIDGQPRTDCWLELGGNPGTGTDIIWKQGTYADRWSIADAANQTLAVYNETIRRSGLTELDNLPDRYGKVTLLMWAHNRGTGLLGSESARESVEKILEYKDELELLVWQHQPSRFARQEYFMSRATEISSYAGCDTYPVMALISYMVVENRYAGRW